MDSHVTFHSCLLQLKCSWHEYFSLTFSRSYFFLSFSLSLSFFFLKKFLQSKKVVSPFEQSLTFPGLSSVDGLVVVSVAVGHDPGNVAEQFHPSVLDSLVPHVLFLQVWPERRVEAAG